MAGDTGKPKQLLPNLTEDDIEDALNVTRRDMQSENQMTRSKAAKTMKDWLDTRNRAQVELDKQHRLDEGRPTEISQYDQVIQKAEEILGISQAKSRSE